ncbi:MAG: DUF2953 domain-containing protein [Desulfotomaculaceae bacterium]|nr:DUF2953 domain-containing protein [Desulfotomaculaceae bacterium]
MDRVFLVFLVFFSLLLFLFFSTIRLWFSYSRIGHNDQLAMGFSTWGGLIYYQFELPAVKVEKKSWLHVNIRARLKGRAGRVQDKEREEAPLSKALKNASRMIRIWHVYKKAFSYLLDKVELRRFIWRTELGVGDPAQTGLLTGFAWGLKGFIVTLVYRLLTPAGIRPEVEISPSYNKVCFKTVLDCVIEVRLSYLALTGLRALIIKYGLNFFRLH